MSARGTLDSTMTAMSNVTKLRGENAGGRSLSGRHLHRLAGGRTSQFDAAEERQ